MSWRGTTDSLAFGASLELKADGKCTLLAAVAADACRESGAALSLAPAEVSADAITAAAERLLAEPPFTVSALAVQSQIDAMPDAETVLAALIAKKAA
jgi:hypothetical protein